MLRHRVIPVLTLDHFRLIKTKKFRNPKYVGDPINAIKIFNDKQVDELIVLDITASRDRREPNYQLIKEIASECFMPIAYGGGISNIDQAKKIFSLGVEKISIQKSLNQDLFFINQLVKLFGSQSLVASVDIDIDLFGNYRIYDSFHRKNKSNNWLLYLKEIESFGFGEILLNCVFRDGTKKGFALEVIKSASKVLNIPLIALGGASDTEDLSLAIQSGASAVAASSMFVFYGPLDAVLIRYPRYDELERLLSKIK